MENVKKTPGQKSPRCDATDGPCDKPGTPGDMVCLCCILGRIRSELSDIAEELSVMNENAEARQP